MSRRNFFGVLRHRLPLPQDYAPEQVIGDIWDIFYPHHRELQTNIPWRLDPVHHLELERDLRKA